MSRFSHLIQCVAKWIVALTLGLPSVVMAATNASAQVPSASGSIFKMLFGLALVLAVMAAIAWALKRMMPGIHGQQSVIKMVGGVSVGTRERVVVLEVAGRWLVVGVAAGQVSAIADLEKGLTPLADVLPAHTPAAGGLEGMTKALVPQFSQWLSQSKSKLTAKKNEQ